MASGQLQKELHAQLKRVQVLGQGMRVLGFKALKVQGLRIQGFRVYGVLA